MGEGELYLYLWQIFTYTLLFLNTPVRFWYHSNRLRMNRKELSLLFGYCFIWSGSLEDFMKVLHSFSISFWNSLLRSSESGHLWGKGVGDWRVSLTQHRPSWALTFPAPASVVHALRICEPHLPNLLLAHKSPYTILFVSARTVWVYFPIDFYYFKSYASFSWSA